MCRGIAYPAFAAPYTRSAVTRWNAVSCLTSMVPQTHALRFLLEERSHCPTIFSAMSRIRSRAYLYNNTHATSEESAEPSSAAPPAATSSSSVGSPRSQQTMVPMRFGPAVSVTTSVDPETPQRRSPTPKRTSNPSSVRPSTPPKPEQTHSTSQTVKSPRLPASDVTRARQQFPPSPNGSFSTLPPDQYPDDATTIGTVTEAPSYLSSPKTDVTSLPDYGRESEGSPTFTLPGELFSTRTPPPRTNSTQNVLPHTRSPSPPLGNYATPEGPRSPEEQASVDSVVTDGDTVTTPTMRNPSPFRDGAGPIGDIPSSRVSVAGSTEGPSISGFEDVEAIQESLVYESTSLSADSVYAKQRRCLLDILNRLHRTGVQQDIDLPQIAVIGSQSVGKSSLIESMSGVNLPRDVGTCTRCPLECRLEYSANRWSCRIFLRLERDASGTPLDHVEEHDFGPVLTEKSAVEGALRRAQRAILRPTLDHKLFLRDRDLIIRDPPPQSFSYNCICMHITGPDVPDLYFYDLPGIIANVRDGGDVKDIELVRNLAKTYISKPSCLVLLTISCETDFENQGAGRLALEIDPEGHRIVGVLTKPDRIENATGEKWASVLRNEENRLVNGWFCVKQPNPTELRQKITWEESRMREDMFFAKQDPWKSLQEPHRRRLGSYNLIRYLSRLLSSLVAIRLPEVERELAKSLEEVNIRLKKLPAQSFEDPSSELVRLIFEFTGDVSRNVKGIRQLDDPTPGLIPAIRVAQRDLRSSVVRTAPRFCPWARSDTPPTSPSSVLSGGTELPMSPPAWIEEPSFLSEEERAPFDIRSGKILYLDEIMERAEQAITRELPGDYPFSVKEELIRMCLRGWSTPMLQYFNTVHSLMTQRMKSLVDLHFGKYIHSGLHARVMQIIRERLYVLHESTLQRLNGILSVEDLPFTLNHLYLKEYKDRFYAHYRDIRRRSRGQDAIVRRFQVVDDVVSTQLRSDIDDLTMLLQRFGLTCTPADLPRLLPEDDLEPALEIMATVRAYFQVAFKRFIDTVPLEVDTEFVRGFDRTIRNALIVGLDIKSSARCSEWLLDSPETVERRKELMATKERLEAARNELSSFILM